MKQLSGSLVLEQNVYTVFLEKQIMTLAIFLTK